MLNRKVRVRLLRAAFVLFFPIVLFTGHIDKHGRVVQEGFADSVVEWIGYAILLVGVGFRVMASVYVAQRKSKQLVTDGPFSLCRNPLYFGTLLATVGLSMYFENFVLTGLAFLVVLPLHYLVILGEEEHLRQLHPEAYADYCRRTPRLWPRPRLYNSPETIDVPVRLLRRALIDAGGLLMLPMVAEFVEAAQKAKLVPVLLSLPRL